MMRSCHNQMESTSFSTTAHRTLPQRVNEKKDFYETLITKIVIFNGWRWEGSKLWPSWKAKWDDTFLKMSYPKKWNWIQITWKRWSLWSIQLSCLAILIVSLGGHWLRSRVIFPSTISKRHEIMLFSFLVSMKNQSPALLTLLCNLCYFMNDIRSWSVLRN